MAESLSNLKDLKKLDLNFFWWWFSGIILINTCIRCDDISNLGVRYISDALKNLSLEGLSLNFGKFLNSFILIIYLLERLFACNHISNESLKCLCRSIVHMENLKIIRLNFEKYFS